MKRWIVFLAASPALAGCATHTAELAPPPAEAEAARAPEAPPAPKPAYGTFGFDEAGIDASVRPGDDFYSYANGTWDKNTQIPADKSTYGAFNILDEFTPARVVERIADPRDVELSEMLGTCRHAADSLGAQRAVFQSCTVVACQSKA